MALTFTASVGEAQVFPNVNPVTTGKKVEPDHKEKEKLAMQYYRSKQYEKAADLYLELYEWRQTQFYYNYYYSCLVMMSQYEKAEKFVKKEARRSKNIQYDIDLGYVYLQMDEQEKAGDIFEEVLKEIPRDKNSILRYGSIFSGRQLYDYAIRLYNEGKRNADVGYGFHRELARTYEIMGQYDDMIETFLELIEEDPTQLSYAQGRLQNVLSRDSDNIISESLRKALLKKSQDHPDNVYFSEMLLWHSIQNKDFRFALRQATSLDKRFGEDGSRVFRIAELSMGNENYEVALEAFNYIIGKGPAFPYYSFASRGQLNARFHLLTSSQIPDEKELLELRKDHKVAIDQEGYTPGSVNLRRDLAHLEAFYLQNIGPATEILEESLQIPGASPEAIALTKIELADLYLIEGEVWEATLLYSQVEKAFKNDPVGHTAKFKNARLSFYIGEFEWARAQLDVLKAATSKLIANDALELSLLISDNMDPDSTYTGLHYYARAELLAYRNKSEEALEMLDSIQTLGLWHPLFDEVLYSKGRIYVNTFQFEKADSMFAEIIARYPQDILADNALIRRARLQEEVFANEDKAMELYQKLLMDYPGSLYVNEARRRFRQLRGDKIES